MATETTNLNNELIEERVLLSWSSLEKPYKARSKDFYSTVLVLAVLVAIVLFFIEGFMPVLVVAAIVFFVFVSSKSQPVMGEHTITDLGVISGGQKYIWDELVVFWIDKRHGFDVVHITTTRRWPVQLVLVAPKEGEGKVTLRDIRDVLLKHLPYEQPKPTF